MREGSVHQAADDSSAAARQNWAGNYTYRAHTLHEPQTLDELRQIVQSGIPLRALGSRHSFNAIADAEDGAQTSLRCFDSIEWDAPGATVWAGAGVTYAVLARWLQAQGCALQNLASLPHITVAGATQTGTHGSGLANGSLSTSVVGLEMMDASGDTRTYSREEQGSRFDGMVVALGTLGIVTRLALRVVPAYEIRQTVYEGMSFETLFAHLEEVLAAGYSVSLFTGWGKPEVTQAWVKQRVQPDAAAMPRELFGAKAAAYDLHPLPAHKAQNCTPQCGVPGLWYERLPHFRSEYVPSSGNEVQSEYFVPLERARESIEAVAAIGARIAPHLFVAEMRTIAADTLWLSPCYGRDSLALHFTWKPEVDALVESLPTLEAALAPFAARPHWGKAFTLAPAHVRSLYPRLDDFRALAAEHDPHGRFRNTFVERYLFADAAD